MSNVAMMMGLSSGAGAVDVADVFSTTLYTGNSTADTKITTGVDLQTDGGLLWTKRRNGTEDHYLWDSINAFDGGTSTTYASKRLKSNETDPLGSEANALMSFETDGFIASTNGAINGGGTRVAWSFKKQTSFFDVISWTGNGASGYQYHDHNLGVTPGFVLIKTTGTGDWWASHTEMAGAFQLNETSTTYTNQTVFWDHSDTQIGINASQIGQNNNGVNYVAYVFAHNEDLIQCGSYTGNASPTNGPQIDLGWKPQWIFIKNISEATDSIIVDVKRGIPDTGLDVSYLRPNTNNSEGSTTLLKLTDTGFQLTSAGGIFVNKNTNDYVYMAIKSED